MVAKFAHLANFETSLHLCVIVVLLVVGDIIEDVGVLLDGLQSRITLISVVEDDGEMRFHGLALEGCTRVQLFRDLWQNVF